MSDLMHPSEHVSGGCSITFPAFQSIPLLLPSLIFLIRFSLICTIRSHMEISVTVLLSSFSPQLLPTPTVGSAGTDTILISKGVHFFAIWHGPVNRPSEEVFPAATSSHASTLYPTDTPFSVPPATFFPKQPHLSPLLSAHWPDPHTHHGQTIK